jgi:non-ribosomal peptide synthetase component F
VGSPATGRAHADLAGIVGYLVQLLPLRADLASDPTFAEALDRLGPRVAAAWDHQDLPLALLTERLGRCHEPGRPPLVQVVFALQQPPRFGDPGLVAAALGEGEAPFRIGPLRLESLALEPPSAQFDLALLVAQVGGPDGGLRGTLTYSSDPPSLRPSSAASASACQIS